MKVFCIFVLSNFAFTCTYLFRISLISFSAFIFSVSMVFAETECPEKCTFDYRPVCAEDASGDLYTFGNYCQFKVAACEMPEKGKRCLGIFIFGNKSKYLDTRVLNMFKKI